MKRLIPLFTLIMVVAGCSGSSDSGQVQAVPTERPPLAVCAGLAGTYGLSLNDFTDFGYQALANKRIGGYITIDNRCDATIWVPSADREIIFTGEGAATDLVSNLMFILSSESKPAEAIGKTVYAQVSAVDQRVTNGRIEGTDVTFTGTKLP